MLKKLLVSLFGYNGSELSRFGNVFAYREFSRIGREIVVAAMNVALRQGFEVIYLDTDSVFVRNPNANLNDLTEPCGDAHQFDSIELRASIRHWPLSFKPQKASYCFWRAGPNGS